MQLSFLPSPMADFANKLVNMEKDEKSDFSLGMKIYVGMRIQNSLTHFPYVSMQELRIIQGKDLLPKTMDQKRGCCLQQDYERNQMNYILRLRYDLNCAWFCTSPLKFKI